MKSHSQYWLGTWNSCDELTWEFYLQNFKADAAAGQLELSQTQRKHLQFFLYFRNPIRPTHFKGYACYVEPVPKERFKKALEYVQKDETRLQGPTIFGKFPQSLGKTIDWKQIKKAAIEGREEEIPDEVFIKYFKTIKALSAYGRPPVQRTSCPGKWLWGKPRTGKSHFFRTQPFSIYIKSQNKWFDGYAREEIILLEDFDDMGKCLGHLLKLWADKWPCYGEIKGGTIPLYHREFWISSNFHPSEIWTDQPKILEAILERFDIKYINKHIEQWPDQDHTDQYYQDLYSQ